MLFFDADGDGTISSTKEFVFTEWDPTAQSDFEALRSYFDDDTLGYKQQGQFMVGIIRG